MTAKTRVLGQVISVEPHLRRTDNAIGAEIRKQLQSEPLTTGQIRIYLPDDADAPPTAREPDTHKQVAVKVEEALRRAQEASVAAMDAVATKDRTNQHASADIIIGGQVLVAAVPVSHLLWLEKYFGEWRESLDRIPVLNPTRNWTYDPGQEIWKSEPEEQVRFVKEVASLLLVPPTDKHPGQAQPYNRETRVGKYVKTDLSGAVPQSRKKELLSRVDAIIAAVKDGIARANQTPVTEPEVSEGEILLGYLLA